MGDGVASGDPDSAQLRVNSHTQDNASPEAILLVKGIDNLVILKHVNAATVGAHVNLVPDL